jgi:hypothetical protein
MRHMKRKSDEMPFFVDDEVKELKAEIRSASRHHQGDKTHCESEPDVHTGTPAEMMYLQKSFTVPAAPEKINCCEKCVYGSGQHAPWCPEVMDARRAAMGRLNCSGPLPGGDVTVVQTGEKTLFIRPPRRSFGRSRRSLVTVGWNNMLSFPSICMRRLCDCASRFSTNSSRDLATQTPARRLGTMFRKCWDLYFKFYTVFLTFSLTAMGFVMAEGQVPTRHVLGAVFMALSSIVAISSTLLAYYSEGVSVDHARLQSALLSSRLHRP